MISFWFERYLNFVTRFPKVTLLLVGLVTLGLAAGLPNFKLDASSESLTLEADTDLDYYRQISKRFDSGDFLVVTFKPNNDLFADESLTSLRKMQDELAAIDGVASIDSILNVPLLYSPKRSLSETVTETLTLETPGLDKSLAKQEFLSSPIYKELILSEDGQTTALQLNLTVDYKYIELVRQRDQLRTQSHLPSFTEQDQARLDQLSEAFRKYRTTAEARAHNRVAEVRSVVDKYRSEAQIFVGGITMITADMISFIRSDLVVFGTAVLLFMIVTLALIFRSWRLVVLPMAVSITAVVMMLGFISWLDWRLTVISSNFVALLLIISLSITIHLVVRYRENGTEHPYWSQKERIQETLRFMAKPCLYTALTTVVAFASLVVSGIRPVIDFGWMMTIGLMVALVLAFVLLPAGLMALGDDDPLIETRKRPKEACKPYKGALGGFHQPLTVYLSKVIERFGSGILLGSLVVAGLSVWGISRLEVENRFIDYFKDTTEIYQGLSVIDNELGGTTTLEIIVTADKSDLALARGEFGLVDEDDPFAEADHFDESDPFETPEPLAEQDPFADADPFSEHGDTGQSFWMTKAGLKKIDALHTYLEQQPEIGVVRSLATLYRVGVDINGGLNDFELALMEKSLPQDVKQVLLSPYLVAEEEQARITLRVKDLYPGLKRKELVDRIKAHIEQDDTFESKNVRFTGLLVLYNNMLQSLFSSQIITLGAVFLAILVMFILLFRSFKIAFIAILPNSLAAISVLGIMGLGGLPLDMMTITIASITVGIGVDDTIHYIHRFKKEIVVDGDYIAAMHRAHASIGRAMYYTSVIIIFGFSIMVLSKFIPTIYFGLLTGVAMFAALMGALLLLPKLIILFKPFGKVQPQ
ncbi:efflux RND transporter permease subunit [Saccharophagus degradans]|uniref:MMPL family transporter n=1 Tax=Saccharophagus degradans TaxID=86304 RepID=A0AAW7XCZ0_9GAMM|nr:MMPL family transporter [Saccharophagus degradans]MDO6424393.1 MMPL family transporter [Saccharophagus degradans]MDO6608400.1 MMPL family transporter [Saccharophagus degradans]